VNKMNSGVNTLNKNIKIEKSSSNTTSNTLSNSIVPLKGKNKKKPFNDLVKSIGPNIGMRIPLVVRFILFAAISAGLIGYVFLLTKKDKDNNSTSQETHSTSRETQSTSQETQTTHNIKVSSNKTNARRFYYNVLNQKTKSLGDVPRPPSSF
jgi:uncharacterized protein HemX